MPILVFRAGDNSGIDSAIRAKHAKYVCDPQTEQVPYAYNPRFIIFSLFPSIFSLPFSFLAPVIL